MVHVRRDQPGGLRQENTSSRPMERTDMIEGVLANEQERVGVQDPQLMYDQVRSFTRAMLVLTSFNRFVCG